MHPTRRSNRWCMPSACATLARRACSAWLSFFVRRKDKRPMHAAILNPFKHAAASCVGALPLRQSRDFGMFDTPPCSHALNGNKEHQAWRHSTRLVASSSQQNQEPSLSHRNNPVRGCVGVHFGAAVSCRLTAATNIQSRTNRSKTTGPKRPAF